MRGCSPHARGRGRCVPGAGGALTQMVRNRNVRHRRCPRIDEECDANRQGNQNRRDQPVNIRVRQKIPMLSTLRTASKRSLIPALPSARSSISGLPFDSATACPLSAIAASSPATSSWRRDRDRDQATAGMAASSIFSSARVRSSVSAVISQNG